MSAIITEKFRQHNANQFIESFTEASASTYYLFLGKATAFTNSTTGGSDSSPPTPADSVKDEAFAWDSMLGAKLISSNDIKNAIPRRNWANGTIYDMYEHDISASNTTTSGASNIFDSTNMNIGNLSGLLNEYLHGINNDTNDNTNNDTNDNTSTSININIIDDMIDDEGFSDYDLNEAILRSLE